MSVKWQVIRECSVLDIVLVRLVFVGELTRGFRLNVFQQVYEEDEEMVERKSLECGGGSGFW